MALVGSGDGPGWGGNTLAYWILKAVLTPILRCFFRVRVEGLGPVPAEGTASAAADPTAPALPPGPATEAAPAWPAWPCRRVFPWWRWPWSARARPSPSAR